MVYPDGFGGKNFEVVSGPSQELIRRNGYDTALKRKLADKGNFRGNIKLPQTWVDDKHPGMAVENRIEEEFHNLFSMGLEEREVSLETFHFEAQVRGAYNLPEESQSDEDARIIAEVFFPAEGGDVAGEEIGSVAYDFYLNLKSESRWQPNADREFFHYNEGESIGGKPVADTLFDGLYETRPHTLLEHHKDAGEEGYKGRMWVRY